MPKPTALHITAAWKITKATDDDKKFYVEGYASHGDADSEGDEISPAAMKQLAELLKTGGADGAGVVLLHNHDADQECGRVVDAIYEEDENRVWVKAFVTNEEIQQKVRDTVINAFSIHAWPNEWRIIDSSTEYRWIIEGWERVVELTVTAMPMNDKAVMTDWYEKGIRAAVKSFREDTMSQGSDEAARVAAEAARNELAATMKSIDERLGKIEKGTEPEPTPTPTDPPEPTKVVAKAIDPKAEAEYLTGQADALDQIEIADEAIKAAVSTVSAGLRQRADEIVVEEEATKTVDDPPAVILEPDPAIKALTEQVEALVTRVDAAEASNTALEGDKTKLTADLAAAKKAASQRTQQELPAGDEPVEGEKKLFRVPQLFGVPSE